VGCRGVEGGLGPPAARRTCTVKHSSWGGAKPRTGPEGTQPVRHGEAALISLAPSGTPTHSSLDSAVSTM